MWKGRAGGLGGCTVETSCLLWARESWGRITDCWGPMFVWSLSLSLFRLQVKPCGRWPGIKHRWRSRVCFASAQHRRWEDAAGSRAAPGPKRGENKAVWVQLLLEQFALGWGWKWSFWILWQKHYNQPIYFFNMEADMAHEQAAVMCFALKYLNFYIYF